MTIKLNLSFPSFVFKQKTIEIKLDPTMSKDDVIDWVFANKKEILKNNGCNLNDTELSSALALGAANVKIIKS